jgi:predicted small lipoprotein YifL
MRAAICSIILALSLGGCGYKGPLYLPKPKPKPAVQKPAPPQQEDRLRAPK